ncbi:MAG: TIGR02281 family clan AA aspartic protease [Pseudomonadota bacterium]|jgi:aspartyl protease family protein|nr:aspartyl protease [Rhodovulum sp. NI22]MDY6859195.1 TIGR02281 family clan AA aspartic protease [Pseudomonadota bacterium]
MAGAEFGRLAYLLLLTAAVGGFFVIQNRRRLGAMAQQAAVWGLIFVGVIAAVGLWSDIRTTVMPRQSVFSEQGRIEVPRAPDGHFYLTVAVNGTPLQFVVDTGASQVVLTPEDARRVGIDPTGLAFSSEARTANGVVQTAPVRLNEVQLGPLEDRNVRAWVNSGEMDMSLLGMSYLQRFEKMEITRDLLVLTR